jgi:Holliday junction resolvasome RuvABC endonuclease subunit
MARVLALDCSTNVGWALFEGPAGRVRFGTWRAPKSFLQAEYGRSFVALEQWLGDMITVHTPDVVGFEAPIMPFAGFIEQRSSLDVVRLLIGLASVVELVATRAQLRCIEVPVPTAKKRLCGTGRATKRDMINAVVRLGHLVEDDHQADAIAVGLATYVHIGASGVPDG